jgi:hypothetical protein
MAAPDLHRQTVNFQRVFSRFLQDYKGLGILLLLAFINGLVYIFVLPPWQHFDEPGHFEFGWLVANRPDFPQVGDYDREMRVSVATSMIEHGFFNDLGFTPDLGSKNEPTWIGVSQVGEPSLYYFILSLPLRLIRGLEIDTQLYVSRLVSLFFFLITVLAAWGITKEVTSPGSHLKLVLPATLALLPSVAVIMTSVNNDVGSIAFFSLFLWGGVRLLNRGFTWVTFILTLAVAVLGIITKNTVYFSLLLIPIILILSLSSGTKRIKVVLLVVGILLLLFVSISWGDARYWYRSTLQSQPTRALDSKAVLGDFALRLESGADHSPQFLRHLIQPLPHKIVANLAGENITLGAWMWADQPVSVRLPFLRTGEENISRKVNLSTEPRFFAVQATLSEDISRLWISITPVPRDETGDVTIYYDGLILVEGNRPIKEAPYFEDIDGHHGTWGGEAFVNLLQNPSAEQGSLMFRTWIDKLAKIFYPDYGLPSFYFSYLSDWQGAGWYYQATATRLFRTFWGQFGWGHVPLLGNKPYRALTMVTVIGVLGTVMGLWHRRKNLPWEVLVFFGLVLIFSWGITFIRGAPHMVAGTLFLPVARYAFSAIIPTVIVLAFGWFYIIRLVCQRFGLTQRIQTIIYYSLVLILNLYSLISIYNFYYSIT